MQQWPIQVFSLRKHASLEPSSCMRIESISDALLALIRQSVRKCRRPQEADPHLGAEHVMPVPAIIQKRDAVALLGQIDEAMGGNLELRSVPTRVPVCRTPIDTKCAFIGREIRAHAHREEGLQ